MLNSGKTDLYFELYRKGFFPFIVRKNKKFCSEKKKKTKPFMLYFPYKIKLYHAFQVCCVNPQTTPKTTANFRTGTINCEAVYGRTVKS